MPRKNPLLVARFTYHGIQIPSRMLLPNFYFDIVWIAGDRLLALRQPVAAGHGRALREAAGGVGRRRRRLVSGLDRPHLPRRRRRRRRRRGAGATLRTAGARRPVPGAARPGRPAAARSLRHDVALPAAARPARRPTDEPRRRLAAAAARGRRRPPVDRLQPHLPHHEGPRRSLRPHARR